MILDKIENLRLYAGVNPYINKVADFLDSHDLYEIPAGRVYIDGDGCFANFDTAHGKTADDAVIETHNRMIDIQIVLDNEEQIGYTPRTALPPADYDEKHDISFYPTAEKRDYMTLRKNEFLMFLPTDGHAPCITEKKEYRKVIFKLKS